MGVSSQLPQHRVPTWLPRAHSTPGVGQSAAGGNYGLINMARSICLASKATDMREPLALTTQVTFVGGLPDAPGIGSLGVWTMRTGHVRMPCATHCFSYWN